VRSSTAEQAEAQRLGSVEVTQQPNGPATVESYAAVYARGEQSGGYIVGRLNADNSRFLAAMAPGSDKARDLLFSPNPIGAPVNASHNDGANTFDVA
jgi:hypothetical protein